MIELFPAFMLIVESTLDTCKINLLFLRKIFLFILNLLLQCSVECLNSN